MQRVEIFSDENLNDLQTVINAYCESLCLEPLAASISTDKDGEYIAAVVVREY